MSDVDKDVYTWVSSAYKWWYNLSLWISELTGIVYSVNSSGPRTETCGYPKTKVKQY